MDIGQLFQSPIFWVILLIAVGFLIYSAFKKQKLEKKNRTKREVEVKNTIKEYLRDTKKYTNIMVEYVQVIPRSGKMYRSRDVFDVFVKIFNAREQKKLISRHAFEIEGVARPNPKGTSKKDILVHWAINQEFKYDEHFNLIKYTPSSRWKIYMRSLNKGKERKNYIAREITKLSHWKKQEKTIEKNFKQKKKQKTNEEQVFRPKMKKTPEGL